MTFNPKHLFRAYLALPKLYSIGGAVVLVAVVLIGGNALLRSPAPTAEAVSGISHVSVASVASLSSAAGPLPVTGKVTSLSEATILAQTSGELVTLNRSIGDRVGAGALIGAFENASQQAAVLQAQGAYDGASAAYAKLTNTTAVNSGITSEQAAQTAANALTSLSAALASAYGALDDAVHTRADQLFTSPRTSSPELVLTVPDSALVSRIRTERIALEDALAKAQEIPATMTAGSAAADTAQMNATAQETIVFLNDLIQAVNKTPPSQNASASTLSGYQTSLATARSQAVGAITSLTSAKSGYDNALASANTSANSAGGGTQSDIASAAANLKQAQGALDAAKASLDKTLVRSPISGTIVSLPVNKGDFVSAYSQVAVVSNPGALYVDVQVTPSDAKSLSTGNKAVIDGTVQGIITFVAPALDPSTNKIEVKVGVQGDMSSLTDGEVVSVALDRNEKQANASANVKASDTIVIPIIAAKITPTGPVVFTVTASSTLSATPITLGSILGDRITVISGLTLDTEIVTDARGLAEGQTVIVD